MHWLNNVHHKQLNLNITHVLRLACESQLLVDLVFFLNICKQLASLSCLLISTLSQYYIPVTKNVWLPRIPKFDPFPRKTPGQLEHQIHFLAPLFSLVPEDFFSCFKLNSLLFQSSHTQISKGSSGISKASSAQYFGYYIVWQLIREGVCTILFTVFFKFEAIHKHNKTTENVSRKQNQNTSSRTE